MSNRVTQNNIDNLHPHVRNIVNNITDKMHEKDVYFFDVVTIIAIANVVISVIRLMYTCYSNNADKALKNMRTPGFFQRLFIKRTIKRNTRFYQQHGNMPSKSKLDNDMFNSMKQQAKSMNVGDIENILGVYKNHGLFKGDK